MSVNIQTGNKVTIQNGNRVLISSPGPQGPAGESSGGTPGGTNTQVQFNDSSAFGGDAGLTYDKTTDTLSATNLTVTGLSTLNHIHGSIAGNLYVHVKNTSGGTLAKGTPVYATGSVGASGEIEVAAADYTNAAKMPAIGILDAALGVNAEGNAVVVGEVTALATNSYAINQELFVGTNGLLGALPASGQAQSIAVVSRVHDSTGIIVVNAQARLNAALTALANNDGSALTGLSASNISTGTLGVANGGVHPLVTTGDNGTGYGRIGLWDGDGNDWVEFQAEPGKIVFPNIEVSSIQGDGSGLTSLNASNISSGTLPAANGGTGLTSPGTSGNVLTSDGTNWTSAAPANNPAGTGSELQFRSSATTFGRVQNSSVIGSAITLGVANGFGVNSENFLILRNTTAALSALQQVSPSIAFEGRGFATTSGSSQTVRFRENILPVQGTTNPSATWRLQSEINNTGTWTDRLTIDSSGVITLANFPASIVMGNATFFGAANGPRFQVTSADIFGLRGGVGLNIAQSRSLGWSSNASDSTEAPDVVLARDAANTLAQRNSTNAQTFRLYETDSGANDEYLELSAASGTNLIRPQATGTGTASVVRYHTTNSVFWTSGSGSPESVVTAPIGSLYTRTDGGAATTLYVKESGTGSTGWVAK